MVVNVARGLFRLWLVLCVLWLVAVGLVLWWTGEWWTIHAISSASELSTEDLTDALSRNLPKIGDIVSGYRFRGGDPSNKTNWQRMPPLVGEVVEGYRYKGGDPRDKNSWERVNEGLLGEDRRHFIQTAVLLAFGPPALLLSLGSVLLWAFRGFRPRDGQHPGR